MSLHICCLQLLSNLPSRLRDEVLTAVTKKPLYSLKNIFSLPSVKKTTRSRKPNPVLHCPAGFFRLPGNLSVGFLFLLAVGSVIQV